MGKILFKINRTRYIKRFLLVVAIFAVALFLPNALHAQQTGCAYRDIGGSYLCVAIPNAPSNQAPIVPNNTAVNDGNTTYYGNGFVISPIPNITYVPGFGVTPAPAVYKTTIPNVGTDSTNGSTTKPAVGTNGSTSIQATNSTTSTCNGGNCCTSAQLAMGTVCTTKNTAANCGCPAGWTCNYIGRPNSTDNSQTIQCMPPIGAGVEIGKACSPAGAPCAFYTYPSGSSAQGQCELNDSGGGYICKAPPYVPTVVVMCTMGSNCFTPNSCIDNTCTAPPPTNTPTPTPTTVPLSCDANHDGKTNESDLVVIKNEWFGGAETLDGDCNHDGKVDGLDFQIWRDVWILKKTSI